MKPTIAVDDLLRVRIAEYVKIEQMLARNKALHRRLMDSPEAASDAGREQSFMYGVVTTGLFRRREQLAQTIGEGVVSTLMTEPEGPADDGP